MRRIVKYLLIACLGVMAFAFSGNVEAGVSFTLNIDTTENNAPDNKIESVSIAHKSAVLVNVQTNLFPSFVNHVKKQRSKRNILPLSYEFADERQNTLCSRSFDYFDARHITFQYSRVNDFYVIALRRIVI